MTHDGRVHVKKLSPEEVNQIKDEVSTTLNVTWSGDFA